METGTTISGAAIVALKWLFPALIGATLAVWYKRNEVDWNSKTTAQKVAISLTGLLGVLIGIAISYALGGAVIESFNVDIWGFQFLIYLGCGLSSLKIIDAVMKNIDPILEIITTGVTDAVKGIVDSITHKWRNKK